MHEQIDNPALQGADEPVKIAGVNWYYGGYVVLAALLHWVILRPLLGPLCVATAFLTYVILLLLSVSREEPRMKNMAGYLRRRGTQLVTKRIDRPAVSVDADNDEVIVTAQGLRMALEVDLTSLDSYDQAGQATLCASLARLVRTRAAGQ